MTRVYRWILAIVSLGATACASSPPTHFVTLDVAAARAREAVPARVPVALGKVELPPELDRAHPVRHVGENRLDIPSDVRWAAPLDELVHRTLALDLAARLPDGEMVLPGQPTPSGPMRLVVVTFRAFSVDSADSLTVDVRWATVEQPGGGIEFSRDARFTMPAASESWADVAGAMSAALGQLADRIASSLMNGGSEGGGSGAVRGDGPPASMTRHAPTRGSPRPGR